VGARRFSCPGRVFRIPSLSTIVVAAALAVVPTLIYLVVLNWIDRYEKEPWTLLIAGAVLGGVVAPLISMAILGLSGRGFQLTPSFAPRPTGADPFVALVEELVSGACLLVLILFVRDELDDVMDGLIYGAAIGAGFGAGETFLYAIGGVALPAQTLLRLVVSGLDHALYTAVFGASLGAGRFMPNRSQRWAVSILGLATAVLLHCLHDATPTILARLLPSAFGTPGFLSQLIAELIPFLGIVTIFVVIVLAWGHEARVLRVELLPEVANGTITQREFETVTSRSLKWSQGRAVYRTHGMSGVQALRRLWATEGELAFEKRRLKIRERRRPNEASADQLRSQIASLRERIGETTPAGGGAA
jgi:RsiW-degrading membrane proteinase PrsW (M82 family)